MKILDCTLRDGGYYTNWDFDRKLVDTYLSACNALPIDYLEVGYRSIPLQGYFGEYFYLPLFVMQRLKAKTNKKLVIILNEKDIRPEHVKDLLSPCLGLIDMVRLAIDPSQFGRALKLAEAVKSLGFEVGFNVMYMSKWKGQKDFLDLLPEVKGIADYFYMVDSYGGVYPSDIRDTIQLLKSSIPTIPLGFHGHNNLELALINTLTALEEGCEMVDATFTGMGRGAGNVKTELLLTALNAQGKLDVDFNPLSKVVDGFMDLQRTYEWGTNLPYMVSGAHSLPQKDVMDWMAKRFYSINSIIRALYYQKNKQKEDDLYELFNHGNSQYDGILIVGGGASVIKHQESITQFLLSNKSLAIIHASSRNSFIFKGLQNEQFYCLIGNEGLRLQDTFEDLGDFNGKCVLPPSPRKMGTFVPALIKDKVQELEKVSFTSSFCDTHTSLALQTTMELGVKKIYLVGYDGYDGINVGQKEIELLGENESLFKSFKKYTGLSLISLTPSKYNELEKKSIYALNHG